MEIEPPSTALVPSSDTSTKQIALAQPSAPLGPKRTSNLQAPTMRLDGHEKEVLCVKISPDGQTLASAGMDKLLLIWSVFGSCENTAICRGHTLPILEVQWALDRTHVLTASADKSLGFWDAETGVRLRHYYGHESYVNSCCPTRHNPAQIVSGSDDGTVKIWDERARRNVMSMNCGHPVTAVCFSEDGITVYSGGLDNTIRQWDVRAAVGAEECTSTPGRAVMTLDGHMNTITGLALSPDGNSLLSNAMDMTVRLWDVRPFCPAPSRCTRIFVGAQHNLEQTLIRCAWSIDGSMVAAGSSDRCVYIWDAATARLLYKLPGHEGTVNEAVFHPTEPIVASAGSDKKVFLGELD